MTLFILFKFCRQKCTVRPISFFADDQNFPDYSDYDDEKYFIRCPPGEVYCMDNGGYCSRTCDMDENLPFYPNIVDHDDDFGNDAILQCPEGTVFCLEAGICSDSCRDKRGSEKDRALWFDEKNVDDDRNGNGCSGNRKFCPAINACADNCDLIEKYGFRYDGPDDVEDENQFAIVCQNGYVRILSINFLNSDNRLRK